MAKMSFLQSGCAQRQDRNVDIWREFRDCSFTSRGVYGGGMGICQDTSQMSFPGTFNWEEILGYTQNTLGGLYIHSGLKHLGKTQKNLKTGARETSGIPCLAISQLAVSYSVQTTKSQLMSQHFILNCKLVILHQNIQVVQHKSFTTNCDMLTCWMG